MKKAISTLGIFTVILMVWFGLRVLTASESKPAVDINSIHITQSQIALNGKSISRIIDGDIEVAHRFQGTATEVYEVLNNLSDNRSNLKKRNQPSSGLRIDLTIDDRVSFRVVKRVLLSMHEVEIALFNVLYKSKGCQLRAGVYLPILKSAVARKEKRQTLKIVASLSSWLLSLEQSDHYEGNLVPTPLVPNTSSENMAEERKSNEKKKKSKSWTFSSEAKTESLVAKMTSLTESNSIAAIHLAVADGLKWGQVNKLFCAIQNDSVLKAFIKPFDGSEPSGNVDSRQSRLLLDLF